MGVSAQCHLGPGAGVLTSVTLRAAWERGAVEKRPASGANRISGSQTRGAKGVSGPLGRRPSVCSVGSLGLTEASQVYGGGRRAEGARPEICFHLFVTKPEQRSPIPDMDEGCPGSIQPCTRKNTGVCGWIVFFPRQPLCTRLGVRYYLGIKVFGC